MTLTEALQEVAGNVTGYTFETDESKMTDAPVYPCIYMEEYGEGSYKSGYFFEKSAQVRLWFIRSGAGVATVEARQQLRAEIERDAILPFIEEYGRSGFFTDLGSVRFFISKPRFHADEVGIMIQFDSQLSNFC